MTLTLLDYKINITHAIRAFLSCGDFERLFICSTFNKLSTRNTTAHSYPHHIWKERNGIVLTFNYTLRIHRHNSFSSLKIQYLIKTKVIFLLERENEYNGKRLRFFLIRTLSIHHKSIQWKCDPFFSSSLKKRLTLTRKG